MKASTFKELGLVALAVAPTVRRFQNMTTGVVPPEGQLERSWMQDNTLAVMHHLRFGIDYVWTYGPLGFADNPSNVSRSLLAIGIFLQILISLILPITLVFVLTRVFKVNKMFVLFIVLTLLVFPAVLGPPDLETQALLTALLLLVARRAQLKAAPLQTQTGFPILAVAAGTLTVYAALTKGSVLPFALALLVLWSAYTFALQRYKDLAGYLLAFVAGWVCVFLFVGGGLKAALFWPINEFQLIRGYSAMSLKGSPIDFIWAAGLVAMGVATVVMMGFRFKKAGTKSELLFLCIPVLLAMTAFKAGFVRQDGHVSYFFFVVPWCFLIAWLLTREDSVLAKEEDSSALSVSRMMICANLLCCFVLVWSNTERIANLPVLKRGISNIPNAFRFVRDSAGFVRDKRHAQEVRAKQQTEFQREWAVTPSGSNALNGKKAFAWPWNGNTLIGLGAEEALAPVPQEYSVYTPVLDRMDAHFFSSAERPPLGLIEMEEWAKELRLQTAPLSFLSILRCYAPESFLGNAVLVASRPCSEKEPVASYQFGSWQKVSLSQWITAPNKAGYITMAEIVEKPSLVGRFMEAAIRVAPLVIRMKTEDGNAESFRVVDATLGEGILISTILYKTSDLVSLWEGTPTNRVTSFSLDTGRPFEWNPKFRIRFVLIPTSTFRSTKRIGSSGSVLTARSPEPVR